MSPDVLLQEQIFRRTWYYAGPAEWAAEPGERFPCRAGDVPLVVVRDRDATLRAFVNVCRHRGSVIVSEQGKRETFQCPYHAWTYDLDGRLRSAPRSEREESFEAAELGLVPAAVVVWGSFVFVNADPGFTRLVDVDPDAYVLESGEGRWSQYGRARSGDGACQFHLVWPALKINVYPGSSNFSIGPVWPEGPERTAGYLDYFFGAPACPTPTRPS